MTSQQGSPNVNRHLPLTVNTSMIIHSCVCARDITCYDHLSSVLTTSPFLLLSILYIYLFFLFSIEKILGPKSKDETFHCCNRSGVMFRSVHSQKLIIAFSQLNTILSTPLLILWRSCQIIGYKKCLLHFL
jgi:hypothetical protein